MVEIHFFDPFWRSTLPHVWFDLFHASSNVQTATQTVNRAPSKFLDLSTPSNSNSAFRSPASKCSAKKNTSPGLVDGVELHHPLGLRRVAGGLGRRGGGLRGPLPRLGEEIIRLEGQILTELKSTVSCDGAQLLMLFQETSLSCSLTMSYSRY